MKEFIDFGGFTLAIEEIKYIKKNHENNKIEAVIISGGKETTFQVNCYSAYEADDFYERIMGYLNAKTLDCFKSSLVKQLDKIRKSNLSFSDEIKDINKNMKALTKMIRLMAKNQSKQEGEISDV